MYSDRQKELSVFLKQLQLSAEEKTEERVIIFGMLTAGAVIVATELFLEYGF